ncbi:uncharacterized protein LOC116347323 [Contarinia nasturtii]|uniref:uncharacterized protein LOC116347323 n=1 Tax=Contarinia nasturtii TaxID=265458 RepID=UPI0012D46F89|nr:uncharacterized protein LOC116347323 [Contarinia nasturtii]
MEIPFIIYADIESLLMSEQNDYDTDKQKNPKGTKNIHIPNSIGYYFHSRMFPNLSHYDSFTGPDCITNFIDRLRDLVVNVIWDKLEINEPMSLSVDEENEFQSATICHICNKNLNEDKVRDHCHLSGKFRGASHSKCNLKYQISKSIPIVFHNLDYDSHFLIEKLASSFKGHISIIPKTSENYISFTKHIKRSDFVDKNKIRKSSKVKLRLTFIDSFRFLQCGLAKLAENLPPDQLKITRKQWENLNEEQFNLLTQKGVYPYEYMDSWNKLNDTQLPPQENFYSDLTNCSISDEQYAFAQTVWDTFNIQTMREYTDIYLKTDVLLLADIFEKFRDSCIKLYELDPAHYYTLPGYSWDCMLRYTGVEIELLNDIDKIMFIERSLRGGISQCSNRHCEANNKYMGDDFNPSIPSNYLIYFDVNNLYGWTMTQSLPISDYKWYNEYTYTKNKNDTEIFDVATIQSQMLNTPDDAPYGYMLEVDLDYPEKLHDLHNDYPFCAEHASVVTNTKKVLDPFDDKRFIIPNSTKTLAWGHYKINSYK